MNMNDVARLANMFPVAFLRPQSVICEQGEWPTPLMGYLHVGGAVGGTDVHAHYIMPEETTTLVHEHKGGRRAHQHP